VADFDQRANFTVDGCVFAGIIDADLDQAEQGSQDETDQHSQSGLFIRQAVGELDIHRALNHFTFPFARQA
jgi:hypothetical protein